MWSSLLRDNGLHRYRLDRPPTRIGRMLYKHDKRLCKRYLSDKNNYHGHWVAETCQAGHFVREKKSPLFAAFQFSPAFPFFRHISPLFPTFPHLFQLSSLFITFFTLFPLFHTFSHFFTLFHTFHHFSPLFPLHYFFQLSHFFNVPHFFQLFPTFSPLFPTFPTFLHF